MKIKENNRIKYFIFFFLYVKFVLDIVYVYVVYTYVYFCFNNVMIEVQFDWGKDILNLNF